MIADAIGGNCPSQARAAAIELSHGAGSDDQSVSVQLLADSRQVLDSDIRAAGNVSSMISFRGLSASKNLCGQSAIGKAANGLRLG